MLEAVNTQDKPLPGLPLHILANWSIVFSSIFNVCPLRHITCHQIPFHFILKKKAKLLQGTVCLLYCPRTGLHKRWHICWHNTDAGQRAVAPWATSAATGMFWSVAHCRLSSAGRSTCKRWCSSWRDGWEMKCCQNEMGGVKAGWWLV